MSKRRQPEPIPDSGTYCPNCKHFTWCDWGKIHATALSIYPCRDFEEEKKKEDAK